MNSDVATMRRVEWVWWLLFANVLGPPSGGVLHLPKVVAELIGQGALVAALVLALTVNRRLQLRSSLYLGIFSLLGVTSLMMSVRLVSLGTAYRGFRLVGFIAVLWLLTPWWGRRDGALLRAQLGFVSAILVSVIASAVVGRGRAFGGSVFGGRLSDVIWPIPATQVAHYSAEMAGVVLVLWVARSVTGKFAVLLALPAFVILILTHTRTALVAGVVGFVVASLSLLVVRRRARRMFASLLIVGALVIVPISPLIVTWLARGQSTSQIEHLTGRTKFWAAVLSEQRPIGNKIFGNGISNGSVYDPYAATPGSGTAIDGSWIEDYQDQGIVGDALTGCMFITLLVCAAYRPRSPARAVALFLIVYCLLASFTEDGAGIASQYAMDLTLAAALLMPPLRSRGGGAGVARLGWLQRKW